MTNSILPLRAKDGVLLSSEDNLFVNQPHVNHHADESQQGQANAQKSRDPGNTLPRPLAPDQQRSDTDLLNEPPPNGRFPGNLLLSRAPIKTLKLNQGFEYGPATPIIPNQFSRGIRGPTPPHGKDQQPSRSHVGFAVSSNTAPKPMSPIPQATETNLVGTTAVKHLTLPLPRPHHDFDLSIVRRGPNDTNIGRLPLKKKPSHAQAMEPPFPLQPRIEAQGRVRNANESTELNPTPFQEQSDFPVDHHGMPPPPPPPPCRDLGPMERAIVKGGQEWTETRHAQTLHEPEGTRSERSRKIETVNRQTSPGDSDRQRTTYESHNRHHQHSGTTSETLLETSPQMAPAIVDADDENNYPTYISEGDPEFRGSNVSKRRSTCPVSYQPPPSTHSSSDATSEPLASSPLNLGVKNTHELSTSMAKAINHFNISQRSEIERQKHHYRRKLKDFERKVTEKRGTIDNQNNVIANQGKEIKALRDTASTLADQIQSLEARLGGSEAQVQSLTEENQASQDQLAKSADESQNLIDRVERRNGELTKEVQALKSSLKQLQDALINKEAREKELEEQTSQDQQEMEDLYQQTSLSKQQLVDANHALDLEKANAQMLLEKLEESKAASKNSESLFAQNEELVRRLEEYKTQVDTQCHKDIEESNSKYDAIIKHLESLNAASAQPDTLSIIEKFQNEFANQVNSKLEGIVESQGNSRDFAGNLSTKFDESIGNFQKQLDHRDEILVRQIEEKTKENSTLVSLLKGKEVECQHHEADHQKQREHSKNLEIQTHDLQEALGLMEHETQERQRQVDASKSTSKGLEEDIVSKEAIIKDLESKLEKKSNDLEEKKEHHSADIFKFDQKLQEKDEASRIAISQAVDVARREVHLDKEREAENVKKMLHQTQQHRDALSHQVGKLNEDSARSEELRRQDAITIASLRETLLAAENRREQATSEKRAQASELERVKARESATLETLKTEMVAIKAQIVVSEQNANTQIEKGTNFVAMLKQLAEQHGVPSVGEDLEKLFEGTIGPEDIASTISQVVDQLGDNRDETHDNSQSSRMDVDLLLSESRRVVVRSPAGFHLEPSPAPTVFQEKERRRQGPQPKSIMKRVTRSMAEPDWTIISHDHASSPGADHPNSIDMSNYQGERESSDPLGNTRVNEPPTVTHKIGTRSRKRSSAEPASSALTSARHKRTRKAEQKNTTELESSQAVPEEDISNGQITEPKAQAKDIGNGSAPRRISGGGRNSTPQSTPIVLSQGGGDVANQSRSRRPSRQQTYSSQKSSQPTQPESQSESQMESQIDSLSSYWPPAVDTQEAIDPLDDNDDGTSQASYMPNCLI